MWVSATGAGHSKSLERRCPRTGLGREPKIIYTYYTRCALIRDRMGLIRDAWDGFARPAALRLKQRVSGM